jgi:hypothetical protein
MVRSIESRGWPYLLAWCRAMGSYGRVALWCSLLTLTAAAGGCQRGPTWNLAPVEGTVTKDGHPLPGIEVTFLADLDAGTEGPLAKGTTDEAGHYRLRTDNGDDGAVVGKHRVVLHNLKLPTKQVSGDVRRRPRKEKDKHLQEELRKKETARQSLEIAKRMEEELRKATGAPRVPPSYGSFNDTPLRVEVRPEAQVIDLDVK